MIEKKGAFTLNEFISSNSSAIRESIFEKLRPHCVSKSWKRSNRRLCQRIVGIAGYEISIHHGIRQPDSMQGKLLDYVGILLINNIYIVLLHNEIRVQIQHVRARSNSHLTLS